MTTASARTSRTALITGATGGIGLDLATLFARDRFNLVLIARRAAELEAVAQNLRDQYGVAVETLAVDLSDAGAAERVAAELAQRSLAVDALVNNAGFAQYGAFAETDADQELRMMQLNMITLTRLTKLLLPPMIERRWGRVMNVASTAAFMPGPLMAVYYASKAYVLSLSEALNEELRGTGVSVTALCPGPTRTGFQARAHMEESKLVRGRDIMASATVAQIGYTAMQRGEPVVIPGAMNRLQVLLPRMLPRRFVPALVRRAQDRGA